MASPNEDGSINSEVESDTSSVAAQREEDTRRRMEVVLKTFDQRDDETIDVTDLGYVFRCMKLNVTQLEMHNIESQLVKEENNSVHFDYLFPRILATVEERKWKPCTEQELELAFQSLETADVQLTKDRLEMLMCSRGEPLSESEYKDMISHVAIRKSGVVDWKSYIKDIIEAFTKDRI